MAANAATLAVINKTKHTTGRNGNGVGVRFASLIMDDSPLQFSRLRAFLLKAGQRCQCFSASLFWGDTRLACWRLRKLSRVADFSYALEPEPDREMAGKFVSARRRNQVA